MNKTKETGTRYPNLMKQFMDSGLVRQDDDGSFVVPGLDEDKKFKPFQEDQ